MHQSKTTHHIRIWDFPTRAFHILLILSVAGLIVSGEVGGDAMQLHFLLGFAVLALLLFRVIWGFVGGHWSRFVNFVPSPGHLIRFIRAVRQGQAPQHIGHNPLGALSVLAMLTLLLVQVLTGFISDDEIANAGPWTALVSGDWVALATEYHGEVGKALLIVLISLHVAMVVFYKYFKKEDLISPMLHGDKLLPHDTHSSRDTLTSRLFALSLLIACAYVVFRLVNLA